MKIIINPEKKEWKELLQRPYTDNTEVQKTVQEIIAEVKLNGDQSLINFAKQFDDVALETLLVTEEETSASVHRLANELKEAIMVATSNIEKFHQQQVTQMEKMETMPGVFCWRKSVAIEKVGLYVPGGTAPLFSTVLMLGLPAKIAGCKEIILCTPPDKTGNVHPAILYCAKLAGITKIFKVGGAQAIAAMAYGTESIPSVYKIYGPGNQYVTTAKQVVQMNGVAIDMPAGPSEVCVLADETANAQFVAADLLSQAEHGADSQVVLVSPSKNFIDDCQKEIEQQLKELPRKNIAEKALQNSKAIIVESVSEAIELINEYAPEHLIISCKNANEVSNGIINAGSVFLGNFSPESVGDYASGTNHTLPTNGFAKAYSGVSVDSFVKKITYQELSAEGLQNIGSAVVQMAEAEGLQAHATAIKIRLADSIKETPAQNTFIGENLGSEFSLEKLVRKNIKELKPYSSARSEYSGAAQIFLDANENSFGSPLTKWYNRYPDPLQNRLKQKISSIKNVGVENIFLGNGSDECIDLIIRAFCEPTLDNIIICPPTYGMYEVSAHINNVRIKEVPLLPNFQLNLDALQSNIDGETKIIFICSPNNPTGNSMFREDIEIVLNNFSGMVVVDEAYINYSRHRSFLVEIKDYPNLVVLQTFSKAWGLAALRLGMAFASTEIIDVLNNIKPPYNINQATQDLVLKALDNLEDVNQMITETVAERNRLAKELLQITGVQEVYPSDANFLLIKINNAPAVYHFLKEKGIIVRNRSNMILCEDCLRITVGTPVQNQKLIADLKNINF